MPILEEAMSYFVKIQINIHYAIQVGSFKFLVSFRLPSFAEGEDVIPTNQYVYCNGLGTCGALLVYLKYSIFKTARLSNVRELT